MPLTCANAERNTSRWLRRAIPVRFGECKRMLDMITLGRQRQSLPMTEPPHPALEPAFFGPSKLGSNR